MRNSLAPTMVEHVKDHVVLWFQNSNKYIVLDNALYSLVKAHLNSKNILDFKRKLPELGIESSFAVEYFNEIEQLLNESNTKVDKQIFPKKTFQQGRRKISYAYNIGNKHIIIHYSNEGLKQLIHPHIEHLASVAIDFKVLCELDIYEESGSLHLFKDKELKGTWPKTDFHLLQGKVTIQILCALHRNEETDWIGTFHASAAVSKDQAVMLIGDSGKGKSTFSTLLLANGFEILADDITPILSKDRLVYPYPGGISVKEGSFDVLNSRIPDFEKIPKHYINPYKGFVKYIAAPKSKGYLHGYPCNKIIRINYKSQTKTILEPISIAQIMQTLIPESWLSPNQEHAKKFLNWIKQVRFYELTYSDSKEAVKVFSDLTRE